MKKYTSLLMIILINCIVIAGCRNTTVPKKEEALEKKTKQSEEIDTPKEDDKSNQKVVENTNNQDVTNKTEENKKEIVVFYPNEEADGFLTEQLEVVELTPDFIVDSLVKKGVLPVDVKVISCYKQQVDGESALDVDLNKEFKTFIQTMGTTGEYMAVGSVCNTFLSAYQCEKMKITIEGERLETGHAEYPDYMCMFE